MALITCSSVTRRGGFTYKAVDRSWFHRELAPVQRFLWKAPSRSFGRCTSLPPFITALFIPYLCSITLRDSTKQVNVARPRINGHREDQRVRNCVVRNWLCLSL